MSANKMRPSTQSTCLAASHWGAVPQLGPTTNEKAVEVLDTPATAKTEVNNTEIFPPVGILDNARLTEIAPGWKPADAAMPVAQQGVRHGL